MAKGILNIQAADGAVIGLHVPDGLTSGERTLALGTNLSGITAYHLLQGNLAVSNYTTTQGFNTTLYTGNGSTQSITTGIDMATQWGNTAEEQFGGLFWLKSRNNFTGAATYNTLFDTIRGITKAVYTNTTNAEDTISGQLISFNNTGISVGSNFSTSSATYTSWNFQTTHRVTGTTNHGKAYTCHYNPFTGFTMVKYTGSGIAGHEIPHHLGRKLGFATVKNLVTGSSNWLTCSDSTGYGGGMQLNTSGANNPDASNGIYSENTFLGCKTGDWQMNSSGSSYIAYGWANSYFDEANKLIGNYEIGVYQGTGVAGNKVSTRGKPAWVMIKRLDSIGNWLIEDNQRGDSDLYANLSNAQGTSDYIDIVSDGFMLKSNGGDSNASGGQYLYMVAYDTNSNGGGSYYPLASDTANLQVNNALIPIAQGIDSNGVKNTILSKNETFSGVTYTQGKNYVYCDKTGAYGVTPHRPRYLSSDLVRTYAGEQPEYFDVLQNKWFNTSSGAELLGTTGWTVTGGTLTTVGSYNQFVDTTLNGDVSKTISTVVGKSYTIVFKTFGTREANITINNVEYQWVNGTFIGTKTINFVANSVSTNITISDGSGSSYTIQFSASMFETAILPTTEITNGRNYLNHIVYADNDGGLLYVEELPKTQYVDEIKANDYKGKNACTAWVNFDGTTTPPTIRDSYNVSAVIRTATGVYDVYFKKPMDTTNYIVSHPTLWSTSSGTVGAYKYINKITLTVYSGGSLTNFFSDLSIHIDGGKN